MKSLANHKIIYILYYMKQLLIEVDQEIARGLDRVAPGRTRRRSEFVRNAIRKALWELEERATAEAYAQQPDSANDAYFDARVWDTAKSSARRRRPR